MPEQYSNRHLVEVNCGFQFPQETMGWDSTFFGQYYDKIKGQGFSEKEERKGVQITFNQPKTPGQVPITSSEVEDQVLFKNTQKGQAILMGKNKISFHVLKGYTNWDDFINQFVTLFLGYYQEIGLGNGMRQCNIVYLNRFVKPSISKLSDYFTFISSIDSSFGLEVNTALQRVMENDKTLLIAKLNSQLLQKTGFNINLECGAVCKSIVCMNGDWLTQANETHAPIKGFFESLITEKLRTEL